MQNPKTLFLLLSLWPGEIKFGFLLDLIVKTLFMSDVIFSNNSPQAATGFPLTADQMATDYSLANSSDKNTE